MNSIHVITKIFKIIFYQLTMVFVINIFFLNRNSSYNIISTVQNMKKYY